MTEREREAVTVLAHIYAQNGHTEKALHLLQALQALAPRHGDITALLAWVYLESADADMALRTANLALSQDLGPEQRRSVLYIKGAALSMLNRKEEAVPALNDFLESAPS